MSRQVLKWSIKLREFDIQYVPRMAIKPQAIANFISKLTPLGDSNGKHTEQWWSLHVDGSANAKGGGAGLILQSPDGRTFCHALHFRFKATNNEAEYEALLSGLKLVHELQVKSIEVFTDSQLVVGHINGDFEARDATIAKYLSEAKKLVSCF